MTRKLSLRREILADLGDADLRAVAGGAVTNTCYSCLTYVSCRQLDCVTRMVSLMLAECDTGTGELTVRC